MINPLELRLGNILTDQSGRGCTVTRIRQEDVQVRYALDEKEKHSYVECEHLEPIPLTEEWLMRFGLIKYKDAIPYSYVFNLEKKLGYNRFRLQYASYMDGSEGFYNCFLYNKKFDKIEHVHQLQNLFFALTGKELGVRQ